MTSDRRLPNMRVQRTRSASLRSPLTRGPLGRGKPVRLLLLAGMLTILDCQASAPLRDPETWQIDIWTDSNKPLGRVVVELTGHRAHGAPDSPARWVEIGKIVTSPARGLDGVGTEAEVRIGNGEFNMNLNRSVDDQNLIVTGKLHGARASGEAYFSGIIGGRVGHFLARRI